MPLKIWMVFEAVAPDRESLEESLQEHVEAMESEDDIEIVERNVDDISSVEKPHPGLEEGFSQVSEVVIKVDGFDRAIETVVNYGPTYIQLEEPDNYELSLREGQEALQNVANTMHQYAQMGPGGVLISREAEDE